MHLLEVLVDIVSKLALGLVFIFTNTTASSPPPTLPPAPLPLSPSGKIVLTPKNFSPAGLETLFPSPFGREESAEKPATSSSPPSIKKIIPAETKRVETATQAAPPKIAASPAPETSVPAPDPEPQTPIAPGDINAQTRAAIVNILCNVGGEGSLDPISGTGIIIDSSGIVLTNAHVGQFFLLRDYPSKNNIDCTLRTGNPARITYRAELLYFPLEWMKLNAEKITEQSPSGTGERDYALLYITGRTDGAPLPASIPHVTPYVGDFFNLEDEMLLAGYPAGFVDGITVQTNLYVASAFGKVREIFTFKDGGGADLISIPGTIISQRGASGGAVVRTLDGKLVGLIATATASGETSQRDLRAITLAHVDKSLTEDTGHNLHYLLTNDPAASARLFTLTIAPTLTKMLTNVLFR